MRVAVLTILLVGATATAQSVYRWTDKDGVTHFSDDPSEVPKGTKTTRTSGDPITTLPSPPHDVTVTQTQDDAPQSQNGGKPDEAAWRQQFQQARERIAELKKAIADDAEVVEPAGLPVRGKYTCYAGLGRTGGCGFLKSDPDFEARRERLKNNRELLQEWESYLADLDRAASAQSIPQEWRK